MVLGILLVVALCFVTLLAGTDFYLPQYSESRILPELIAARAQPGDWLQDANDQWHQK